MSTDERTTPPRTDPSRPDRLDLIMAAWAHERPDLDVTPQGVIGRLHRVANHLTDELLTVFKEHDLTEGDFDVLATLRRTGPPYARSCGELAEHTLVTSGGVSKRVDRLERAGLVARHVSPADGRGRDVVLTTAGRLVIDKAFAAHIANEQRLLAVLEPDDVTALEGILRRWLARLEEPPATA